MASPLDDLLERAGRIEREIEHELNRAREHWRYRIDAGRVRFEQDVRAAHQRLKQSIPAYLRESNPLHLLVAPVIYSLIVPIAILDIWISLYQVICFPIFGISRVRRDSYIVFDRHHLAYLNLIEKMNCGYCGYANGVLAYVREIAGRTEQVPVPDPAREARARAAPPLPSVRRLRRCGGLSAAAAAAAGTAQGREDGRKAVRSQGNGFSGEVDEATWLW